MPSVHGDDDDAISDCSDSTGSSFEDEVEEGASEIDAEYDVISGSVLCIIENTNCWKFELDCAQRAQTFAKASDRNRIKWARDSKPDSDANVCQIAPNLLWIHYFVCVKSFCGLSWKSVSDCMRNANKSPKIYFTVVTEGEKWSGIYFVGSSQKFNQFLRLVGPIVTMKSLITFAVILHTDGMTDKTNEWWRNWRDCVTSARNQRQVTLWSWSRDKWIRI